MKAITTRYLSFTNTKPSRIKASAEGVKPLTVTTASLDRNSVEDLHIQAAKLLCKRQDWPTALASGGTASPDVWVHCFVPDQVPAPVSVNDQLAGALENLLEYSTHGTTLFPGALVWGDARQALANAKPFLRGQEGAVFQARALLNTAGTPKADGTVTVSAYHLECLKTALADVGKESPLVSACYALANTLPGISGESLLVDSHAWACFKAELNKF